MAESFDLNLDQANLFAHLTLASAEFPAVVTHSDLEHLLGALSTVGENRSSLSPAEYDRINRLAAVAAHSREGLEVQTALELSRSLLANADRGIAAATSFLLQSVGPLQDTAGVVSDFLQDSSLRLSAIQARRATLPLCDELTAYDVFAMPFGWAESREFLSNLSEALADADPQTFVVRVETLPSLGEPVSINLAASPLVTLTDSIEHWPGVLFWTSTPTSYFAPVDEAEDVLRELKETTSTGGTLRKKDEILNSHLQGQKRQSLRLLHLSDLHFGKEGTESALRILRPRLKQLASDVDRVLITGDLVDDPTHDNFERFREFYESLKFLDKEPIVIPGNHDERPLGNKAGAILKEKLRPMLQGLGVSLSRPIVDDATKCTFLCFDSSEGGEFARGSVSTDQLRDVDVQYVESVGELTGRDKYPVIALVHHHPYDWTRGEPRIGIWHPFRRLKRALLNKALEMDDAKQFVDWCAERNVGLILHGHKHVPRYVSMTGKSSTKVVAVCCGSSLGHGENQQSWHNIVQVDPVSQTWSVQFFVSDRNSGRFRAESIEIEQRSI